MTLLEWQSAARDQDDGSDATRLSSAPSARGAGPGRASPVRVPDTIKLHSSGGDDASSDDNSEGDDDADAHDDDWQK